MKGWCPRHDRMFDAADGLCPECGTALVDVSRARSEPRIVVTDEAPPDDFVDPIAVVEPQTVERSNDSFRVGTPMLAGIVTVTVLVAFLFGLAFPRGRERKASSRPTPQAQADHVVRRERTGAGVRLRLESFSQRGKRVVMRVTVPEQSGVDIGRITGAYAAPVVSDGLTLDGFPLEVRTTVSGFVAEGEVFALRSDLPIEGIRILNIEMITGGTGRAVLDLSRVWGDSRRGPVASDRVVGVSMRRRTLRVVGMVGWPDHLEVQVEDRGVPEGWDYSYQFKILPGEAAPADGEQLVDFVSRDGKHLTTVSFHECGTFADRCLPRGIARANLLVEAQNVNINGDWRWQFL